MKRFIKETAKSFFPLLAIVALWWFVSLFFDALLFPSPQETISQWNHLFTDEFASHLSISLIRIGIGASLALVLGVAGALVSQLCNWHHWVESCMTMFQVLPGLIIAVIFLLLFGVGSVVPIALIVFMVTPLITVNTTAASAKKEAGIEMLVSFYGGGFKEKICDIYLPRLMPCMRANCLLSATMGIKVCLLGEFIGAENGLGYLINISRMYFDMPAVFFYVAIILLLIFCFQLLLRLFFYLFLQKYFYSK